jgi:hypothetical protein
MDSFSYLKAQLAKLTHSIPFIRIRYSFDPEFKNHIIEVKPSDVYNDDLTFAEHESELCLDFSEKFPYDSIIFISEDDAVKIEHPDLVLLGSLYEAPSNFNWSDSGEFYYT